MIPRDESRALPFLSFPWDDYHHVAYRVFRYKRRWLQRLLISGASVPAVIDNVKPGPKGSLIVWVRYNFDDLEVKSKKNPEHPERPETRQGVVYGSSGIRTAGSEATTARAARNLACRSSMDSCPDTASSSA